MTTVKERNTASDSAAKDPLAGAVKAYRKRMIHKLFERGVSQAVIADVFGVSRQSVHGLVHSEVTEPDGAVAAALLDGWQSERPDGDPPGAPGSDGDADFGNDYVETLIGVVRAYHRNVIVRLHAAGVGDGLLAEMFGVSEVAGEYEVAYDGGDADVLDVSETTAPGTSRPGRVAIDMDAVGVGAAVATAPAPAPAPVQRSNAPVANAGIQRRGKLSRAQRKAKKR